MRARAAALVLVAAAAGCGGDVYAVDVHPAVPLFCDTVPLFRGLLRSVGIEVVRESGSGLEQIADLGTCASFPETRQVRAMLDAFDETGVIVEGVPADTRTILRFVGYLGNNCQREGEIVCGITCPPIRLGDIPDEGVTANFICERANPDENATYRGCLNLELLTEEQRANFCSRVE